MKSGHNKKKKLYLLVVKNRLLLSKRHTCYYTPMAVIFDLLNQTQLHTSFRRSQLPEAFQQSHGLSIHWFDEVQHHWKRETFFFFWVELMGSQYGCRNVTVFCLIQSGCSVCEFDECRVIFFFFQKLWIGSVTIVWGAIAGSGVRCYVIAMHHKSRPVSQATYPHPSAGFTCWQTHTSESICYCTVYITFERMVNQRSGKRF